MGETDDQLEEMLEIDVTVDDEEPVAEGLGLDETLGGTSSSSPAATLVA